MNQDKFKLIKILNKNMIMRKTKIIFTIGPDTSSEIKLSVILY